MKYTVEVLPQVLKALAKIDNRKIRNRLIKVIDDLADEPRPHGCEKLTGVGNRYRIRKGDYRVIYSIEDEQRLVVVLMTGHRRDVYDNL